MVCAGPGSEFPRVTVRPSAKTPRSDPSRLNRQSPTRTSLPTAQPRTRSMATGTGLVTMSRTGE